MSEIFDCLTLVQEVVAVVMVSSDVLPDDEMSQEQDRLELEVWR